jgi:hypothetical protein
LHFLSALLTQQLKDHNQDWGHLLRPYGYPDEAIDPAPTTSGPTAAALMALHAQLPAMLTEVHQCHVWALPGGAQATQLAAVSAGQQHLDRLLAAEPLDLTVPGQ